MRLLLLKPLSTLQGLNVRVADQYRFFKNKDEFFLSYDMCESKLSKMEVDNARQKLMQDENTELKKMLSFYREKNTTSTLAYVIGKEISEVDQVLVLDQGQNAGISVGQPVIAGEGVLVGMVIKVTPQTSLFRLVNDNQSRIAATILNRDHSLGVVEGGYGISLRMGLIPRDETILVGDQIVTSGLEQNIPRGLVIGSVTAVENEPYQPFQQAILTPAINVSKLTIVGVLTSNAL